jgi:type VI secretion system secreted protein VgrG
MADTRSVNLYLEAKGTPWDHVRVRRLAGREAISELFSFDVDVVCDPEHDLPDDALPGADITVVFEIDGVEARRVHGLLGPVRAHLDAPPDRPEYRLRVVPRASRLALVETQEIYLGKTVPEILRSKLEHHDFVDADFELRLMGTYPAREFVVQFKESDLAFVSRLAEHVGISYFFEHDGGSDKLVFTDHPGGFRPTEGAEEVPFRGRGETADVFGLDLVTGAIPSSYIVHDYNYRTPLVDLSASFDVESGNGGGVVEYGSHAKTPEEAERLAKIRGEERACRQRVYEGKSGRPALYAGGRSAIVDHPKLRKSEPLLVVAVTHEATLPVHSEEASSRAAVYANAFEAIPADVQHRPRRVTPRPVIAGMITGVIQPGPDGETGGAAKMDSEGRYTVQLHFDTAQPGEQKASHPVRMAQPYAGSSYGMHFPLRPGTEVLLAFTNGDPDRPVIVGALYNATSPSPVVAANANTNQLKSSSGAIFEFGSRT